MDNLKRFLERRREDGILRELAPAEARSPGRVVIEGREFIDFSSNDYLGFSAEPALKKAAEEAVRRLGTGSGASRLMSGNLELHHELERETAAFKGKEAALLFNSGYQANVGIIPALAGREDAVFADRAAHASLLDGILLSRAVHYRFRHNDTGHLADLLERHRADHRNALIVTETVFSMDGDLAPLPDLVDLKDRHGCRLLVDEAHATGVFGPHGSGCVEDAGLSDWVEFVMGTFSKALGGFGAYLAADAIAVEYLVNAARSFVYSTALPPPVVAADVAAVRLCREEPERGSDLLAKADRFRRRLREHGWQVKGESQIVPVLVGESGTAVRLAARLREREIYVLPVRPPTVPEGSARLRFSLCSRHTFEQLERVLEALGEPEKPAGSG
jgi:8-amino-7-oxononanoate synthase